MHDKLETTAVETVTKSVEEIRKQAIVDALGGFIEELKLVDVLDFLAYVRMDKHDNIADLVSSAAELSFREGTLRYAMSASASVDWDRAPEISLNLEFFNDGLWLYFTLVLGAPDNRVLVDYIETSPREEGDTPPAPGALAGLATDSLTRRLLDALRDARISR
ncbi:hypothetical protein [Roseibium aestuarii]|uniref:Uncharacterized protein n=1 Tax=Roseibium aestuarii TaxID=2600299 RepID=A0ABW4K026_9HYPH|nr:hypothetical protein [Roseibium aestuarii]